MHALRIPSKLAALLLDIQAHAPGAIIGGGFLRDLDNNRTVKDVDIFIPHDADIEAVTAIIKRTHPRMLYDMGSEYHQCDKTITDTMQFSTDEEDDLPIGLIVVASHITPAERFTRFDFGLCQIIYDGKGVITTAAYDQDKKNETLTLMRAENSEQFWRSMTRYGRLSQKYDWPLVIPMPLTKYLANGGEMADDELAF